MFDWLWELAPAAPLTGPMLTAYVLFDIVLIVALARVLGNLMIRVGQPRVVGEIFAGILLGPTLLGAEASLRIAPAEVRPILGAISSLGLILFMFLAGLEFDRSRVHGRLGQAGLLSVLSILLPALLAIPLASLMHKPAFTGEASAAFLPFALFLGAALSVTAFPVMAHILMERGELNSPMGSLGVATAGLISVLMFLFIGFAGQAATARGWVELVIKGFLILLLGAVSWMAVRPWLGRVLKPATRPGAISGNHMALLFGGLMLYGLIADRIGLNALVGGFAWGLVLPEERAFRQEVASKVRDLALILLLPIFFAMAGFSTDLKLVTPGVLPIVALVLLVAVAGKFLAAVPARAFGRTWAEVGILGALFNTRGLLVLVAGMIGLQLEIISILTFTIIVIVALVTNLMTLPILNWVTQVRVASTPLPPVAEDAARA